MNNSQLQAILSKQFPTCDIKIGGDGHHFEATLIGDVFLGKTKVARQQLVYAAVADYIKSGELHALNIHAHTSEEWSTL